MDGLVVIASFKVIGKQGLDQTRVYSGVSLDEVIAIENEYMEADRRLNAAQAAARTGQ